MGNRMSNIATPMPQIRARFTSKLGIPLSGCKVYTYEPNSNIPKTTWIDIDKTVENTNPILLDAAGEADIFLDGLYQIVVKDRFGFVVYDVEKTGTHTEWDASFVVDESGQSQQQVNNGVTTIADLASIPTPKDGTRVFVKSALAPIIETVLPYVGGGLFVFSTTSTLTADGFLVVDATGGKWIKLTSEITVDDFGARGDGSTDDSPAFNAYASSPNTPLSINLPSRKAVFAIYNEVDCNMKGIVGHYVTRNSPTYHEVNSIRVKAGNYPNGCAFNNVANELRGIMAASDLPAASDINGFQTTTPQGSYDFNFNHLHLLRFKNQIVHKTLVVNARYANITSMSANERCVFGDTDINAINTTISVENFLCQYAKIGAIEYIGQVWGSKFAALTFERCNGGLKGRFFKECYFTNIWAERTQDDRVGVEWLQATMPQQNNDNVYGMLHIDTGWADQTRPLSQSFGNAHGGISMREGLAVTGSTGSRITLTDTGITSNHAAYLSGAQRVLEIAPKGADPVSGIRTPLVLRADSGYMQFLPISGTGAIIIKRQTGDHIGDDVHNTLERYWTSQEVGSAQVVKYHAPLNLTWDTIATQPLSNGGWVLSKIAVGQYRISRAAGNTQELRFPHISVGGVFSSTFLTHRLAAMDSYGGSWGSFRAAAGIDIYFANAAGAATDPTRFTVSFTLRN